MIEHVVLVQRIRPDLGGGFAAMCPCLGDMAATGSGATVQEAYDNLMECIREIEPVDTVGTATGGM